MVWVYGGLVASVALVVAGYYWASGMMQAQFAYRSPLKEDPPAPVASANRPLTGRAVLVLIDALRLDTSQDAAVMPTLARLRAVGASATMHSRPPSYSEPGYTTLLTGAWPDINDGPPINLAYEQIHAFTQDDLFSSAHRAGLKTGISGYYWFEKLVPQAAVDAFFYTPGEDAAADEAVLAAALPWLRSGGEQLVLIHLDQVDYAGHHEGGPQDPRWKEAAARADGLLAQVLAGLDLSKDTLAVFSDHGQIDRGGHGGNEPVTLVEPLVLAGAGVKPGVYGDVQMVDLAPTLAALLGVGLPASAEGRPLVEMLSLGAGDEASLKAAWESQQAALAGAYRKAIGMTPPAWADETAGAEGIERARAARLVRERAPRALVALLLALALGRLVWGVKEERTARLLAAGAFLAVFNLGYLLVSARTYSLSSVGGPVDVLTAGGGWALGAFAAAAGVFAWRGGLFRLARAERTAALMRLSLSLAYVLLLPVLAGYALNGWRAAWTLPEPTSAFVALISAVQIMFISAAGLLLGWGARLIR